MELSAYSLKLIRGAMRVVATLTGATAACGSVQRIARLLDASTVQDGARQFSEPVQELRFEGVEYGYPSEHELSAFVDVSAAVYRGRTISLRGPNRSGTSTFVPFPTGLSASSRGGLILNWHTDREGRFRWASQPCRLGPVNRRCAARKHCRKHPNGRARRFERRHRASRTTDAARPAFR